MSIDNASTDFTQRPQVPQEYVDTADLMEAVTGRRPGYFYDVRAGEWRISYQGDAGIWPDVYGYMRGVADSGDGVSLLFSIEEQVDGSRGVWLHLDGTFGKVRCWLTADDARLWAKLLKKAAKKVQS